MLSLVLYETLGWSQIYIRGPCAPRRLPSEKILLYAQVLANICIIVNFQLRSSINAGQRSALSIIGFALKGPQKWSFGGILGAGAKMFGGNPPSNAMTADLRRLVEKL